MENKLASVLYKFVKRPLIYSFPDAQLHPELYARWMENVKKNAPVQFVARKGSRLCSEHFSVDVMQQVGQRIMLLPGAVPTIFQNSQVCVYILVLC